VADRLDVDELVAVCATAAQDSDPQTAVAEALSAMLGAAGQLLDCLKVDDGAAIWHESDVFTVAVIATPPGFRFWPHEHGMWAVTGMLAGVEHNEIFDLDGGVLRVRKAFSIDTCAARGHPPDVIHTAANPGPGVSWGVHVFGGNPATAVTTEWDPDTGSARTVDLETRRRRLAALEAFQNTIAGSGDPK
jgi:predicted metal-dependent enzyme (double-stranded beta helix superfamily)